MNCSILITPMPGETYLRRDAAEKYFKRPYLDGELVEVTFEKANGEMRTMLCRRSATMESQIKGFDTKTPNHIAVCEEGRQWRKVNMDRIVEVRI